MSEDTDDTYGDPPPIGDNNPPATYEEELRRDHADLFVTLETLRLNRDKIPAVINTDDDLKAAGTFIVEARKLERDIDSAHKKASAPHKAKATACDVFFLKRGLTGDVERLKAVVAALADDYTTRKATAERLRLQAEADKKREEEQQAAYEAEALKEAGSHSTAEVVESQAEHLGKRADRLATKAEGSVAEVVRTNLGGVTASGREKWVFEIEDAAKLDLNVLRDTIYGHELAQIIQRYVDGGGRDLPGARIYPKTIATFR